jgi:RNA polymerase sigma-32 factor
MQSSELINNVVKQHPVLPSDQQIKLVKTWQESADKMALEKLILSNLKAVFKEAARIKRKNYYLSYDDLIQEGVAGLLKAANMFDAKQEVAFLTYAMWWIKANMRRYVMDYRSIVRMGTTRDDRALFSNLSKSLREAEESGLTGEDKLAKVAERLSVSRDSLNQMIIALKGFDVRLDMPVSNDNETLKVDLIKDTTCLEGSLSNLDESTFLSNAIIEITKSLPDDEKTIIENRFLSDNPKTLRDLAKEMNISREWVRKLEIKALDRFKKRLATKYNVREYSQDV